MKELKTCPFCGGKVNVALIGDFESCYWSVHHLRQNSKCRIFMESEKFDSYDDEAKSFEKERLIRRWNQRNESHEPAHKPKLGDFYYVPWCKLAYKWRDNIQDNIFLEAGMVCRTRQEIEPLWDVICKAAKEYRYGRDEDD